MRAAWIAVAVWAIARPALSQTVTPGPPAFEVASIKPSGPKSNWEERGGPGTRDPGRYYYHCASLLDLILSAYAVQDFQVSSRLPLDRQSFDLDARVPDGATKEQFHEMLQRLLAERFHLKLHTVSRMFPAYEMSVAKTGPRLRKSTGESAPPPKPEPGVPAHGSFPDLPPGRPGISSIHSLSGGFDVVRLRAQQKSTSALGLWLQPLINRPIVDQTGLTGNYDFTLGFASELPNATPDSHAEAADLPDLFTALQQQLGLQLVEKKLPFDVLIIDSADRLPTEN